MKIKMNIPLFHTGQLQLLRGYVEEARTNLLAVQPFQVALTFELTNFSTITTFF